jgi:hypothetical protein
MLYEISFVINLNPDYLAYFLLSFGFGIGFYYIFYSDNSDSELDRMKHDLAVKKEWIRMLAEQRKSNPKWPAAWARANDETL